MDYLDHATAIDAITRTIETDVIGRVADPYARSQLWVVAGILANVARELEVASSAPDVDATPQPRDVTQLLTQVREDVARQRSLHYRKAVTGAE